ncbi:MAG: hypothetical protein J5802_10950 [Butyrivibrio sp.]|nr:hypothetical protein [Butyrivibrio sp.]
MFFENKIIVWGIVLAVILPLAFITFKIAKKKGYNIIFFLIYSILAPGFSLLHVSHLPDKSDTTKRMFSSKALVFNALAVIIFANSFFLSVQQMVLRLEYSMHGGFGMNETANEVRQVVLMLFLAVSITMARKYIFSLVIYTNVILNSIVELIFGGAYFLYEEEIRYLAYHISLIIAEVMVFAAHVVLIYIVNKFGLKACQSKGKKNIPVFMLPAIFMVINAIICAAGRYYSFPEPGSRIDEILMYCRSDGILFLKYLFLGLFYYEDSKDG